MSRSVVLTDAQWVRIESLPPSSVGRRGRPFRDDRRVVEGIIFRFRTGSPWRGVAPQFGPGRTVWEGYPPHPGGGTWDRIHARLLRDAGAADAIDWSVSVDSTVNRAHQHATNLTRDTGGSIELQESAGRAS